MISRYAFSLVAILLAGCETIHGVSSYSGDDFPKLTDKQCVVSAVKNAPNVRFLSAEEGSDAAKTILNKPIHIRSFIVRYAFKDLSIPRAGDASLIIYDETNSKGENKRSYGNSYGYVNGPSFTKEELAKADAGIQAVNEAVWKSCKLTIAKPVIKVH